MAGRPRFQSAVPNYFPRYPPRGVRPNFPVRPAPARFPAVKRLMPAAGSMDVKRMRMASAVMPAQPHTPTSTVSASSSMENQHQNPISVLNQYKAGLNYHVIGEYGPPHLKNFTCEVTVDEQVFHGSGESKAAARYNVAQAAMNVLGAKIEAELECRKVEKQQKIEAKKAERLERLKREAEEKEREGEKGSSCNDDEKKEVPDKLSDSVTSDTEQKPHTSITTDVGLGSDQETKPHIKSKSAVRVLKDIRPGISCSEKVIPNAPTGHYVAQVVVDGITFEGQGDSLGLAKGKAAESALSTLFNLSFQYSSRGFPMYAGDAEEYMHLRRSDLMKASADEKNAIMVLNELYYESAVYTEIQSQPGAAFYLISVTVDGITVYGRGSSRKEAKFSAACAAVEQLRCLGLLQKRLAEKESVNAERKSAAKNSADAKPVPYRHSVCSVVPENAIAKLNHLYKGLNYNVVDAEMLSGPTSYSYTVSVNVNGQDFCGTGRSKKVARLAAAENALRALNMWTEEDDTAKKQAKLSALAAVKTAKSSVNVGVFGRPVSAGRPLPGGRRGFHSLGNFRGKPNPRARGMVHGQRLLSSGTIRGRGSFLGGQTRGFPNMGGAQPGPPRGPNFRARGSGMLRRGTRGGGRGARGAANNVRHIEIPNDKNPVMLINEVYYSTAVYEYTPTGELQMQMDQATVFEQHCSLRVDGITAYGTAPTRKDAKLNAAASAVQQLQAAGILQKRLADKAAFMSQKNALNAVKKANYFAPQSNVVPTQGFARMHRASPVRGRGRTARRPGSRGRGLHNMQSSYPQNASTDVNIDFTTLEDAFFTSFEDTQPNRGTVATRQYHAPQTASRGQWRGRMLHNWS